MATLMTPVSVSARAYTSKELGYGSYFAIGGRKHDKSLVQAYTGNYKNTLISYRKTSLYTDGYTEEMSYSCLEYTFKVKNTTKYYRWTLKYGVAGRHFYKSSRHEFIRYMKAADLQSQRTGENDLFFRFKLKHGYATSVVFGREAWN